VGVGEGAGVGDGDGVGEGEGDGVGVAFGGMSLSGKVFTQLFHAAQSSSFMYSYI